MSGMMPFFIFQCLVRWVYKIIWSMRAYIFLVYFAHCTIAWSKTILLRSWRGAFRISWHSCWDCARLLSILKVVPIHLLEYSLFDEECVLEDLRMELAVKHLSDSCFVARKLFQSLIDSPLRSVGWVEECLVYLQSVEVRVRSYVCEL